MQPNQLVGFSIFEDDHPNHKNDLKHVVILHRGNDDKPV
jgi:hypothetical protein